MGGVGVGGGACEGKKVYCMFMPASALAFPCQTPLVAHTRAMNNLLLHRPSIVQDSISAPTTRVMPPVRMPQTTQTAGSSSPTGILGFALHDTSTMPCSMP